VFDQSTPVRLGLVRRDPDPLDGRGVIVRYTEGGLAGLAIARRRMLELEDEYAAHVGAKRWSNVRAALETSSATSNQAAEHGPRAGLVRPRSRRRRPGSSIASLSSADRANAASPHERMRSA
jgi:hypothetical protein